MPEQLHSPFTVEEYRGYVERAQTEADFQRIVIAWAEMRGWMVFHDYDSRRSNPGFPDLVLVREGRLLFVELKTMKGKLSTKNRITKSGRVLPSQEDWLEALVAVEGRCTDGRVKYRCWRPNQWDEIVAELC